MKYKSIYLLIVVLLVFAIVGCSLNKAEEIINSGQLINTTIEKDGVYSTPEEVAEYIRIYQQLPKNYLTKKEAAALGWESNKGNLWDVTDKMSIGGDVFGNFEGLLPKKDGRKWYECDVNYYGGYRGPERIVYSNDGLMFYTKDHYKTFVELLPKER
jgi:guanyl-specific ribonuclease Sa